MSFSIFPFSKMSSMFSSKVFFSHSGRGGAHDFHLGFAGEIAEAAGAQNGIARREVSLICMSSPPWVRTWPRYKPGPQSAWPRSATTPRWLFVIIFFQRRLHVRRELLAGLPTAMTRRCRSRPVRRSRHDEVDRRSWMPSSRSSKIWKLTASHRSCNCHRYIPLSSPGARRARMSARRGSGNWRSGPA